MDFDYSILRNLPSPFYRVSLKLIVRDNQNRILVGKASDKTWELPGGGFEHDETIEECANRELQEELGVNIKSLGKFICIYTGINVRGFRALKIALEADLESTKFKYGELVDSKFVIKEELLKLPMNDDEAGVKERVNLIWPS